jgi:3-hydroxyacyl-CoA dehydrogenase
MILATAQERGLVRTALSVPEIQARALAAIVNEAANLMAEGVALRPGDIDVVMVNGYGFPRWVGGPVHWARQQEFTTLAEACARAARMAGPGRVPGDLRALGIMGENRA